MNQKQDSEKLFKVEQILVFWKKGQFLLNKGTEFWLLAPKCAILCGKGLHRMKIYQISFIYHYCNILLEVDFTEILLKFVKGKFPYFTFFPSNQRFYWRNYYRLDLTENFWAWSRFLVFFHTVFRKCVTFTKFS